MKTNLNYDGLSLVADSLPDFLLMSIVFKPLIG